MEAQCTLKSLLVSNDPPLDAEIPVIRGIIANEQSQLLDLDTRIAALQKILEPLVDERNATADRILRHQSVISVGRRVPPEILGEIFLFTLPSQEGVVSHTASCVDSSPWLVSRICSRWRKIALARPELWTTVSINHLSYDLKGNDAYPSVLLCRLKTLLHRSANQSLHMDLGSPYMCGSPEVIEALSNSSPRWETVQAASDWFSPDGPMERIKGKLDRLKSLSFYHGSPQGELFAEAPQLRRLKSIEAFTSDFPWKQLTYLDSRLNTFSEFTLILPHLVNVVECHIRGRGWEEDDTVTHDTITLPALQKIYLDGMPLPSSLITPRLTHITMGLPYLDTLPHVVSRSGCDLQSVVLLPPLGFATRVSFSALRYCPTIRDLEISSHGDINALCATLTVRHDTPIWLPELNDIKFILDTNAPGLAPGSALDFAPLNLETFVAMLKSRWNVAGCARICHVHIEARWHNIELQYIEALLSRLVEFDDGELSLWLTDLTPLKPSWEYPGSPYTPPILRTQVSRRLRRS